MRRTGAIQQPLAVLVLLLCSLVGPAAQTKPLDIYFIDVEGGQATLIVTPAYESMLIDTGYPGYGDRDVNRILATIKQAGLHRLDYLLVTHYHNDHVGNAATIASRIPVTTFVDHGPTVETSPEARALYDTYVAARTAAKHVLARPGHGIPLRDVTVGIVAANGERFPDSQQRAPGPPNPACAGFTPQAVDTTENARSVGTVVEYGRFRMLNLGDLTWNKEHELVCPVNLLGTVDVYLTSHHGLNQSGPAALVHSVRPRVAIMNNGPTKGGEAEAMKIVRSSPGLEDFWQLHYAVKAGDANMPPVMIANLDESTAHYLKLSAQPDGSFTVTNGRTGETRAYKPRPAGTGRQ